MAAMMAQIRRKLDSLHISMKRGCPMANEASPPRSDPPRRTPMAIKKLLNSSGKKASVITSSPVLVFMISIWDGGTGYEGEHIFFFM
jgi:hypothetical protein